MDTNKTAGPAKGETALTPYRFRGLGKVPVPLLAALRRGDRDGVVAQLAGVAPADIPERWRAPLDAAVEMALELRRESVSVLGNHEAFVRHTADGSLHQVIAPVRLSIADKTLYQILVRRPCKPGTLEVVGRDYRGEKEWKDVPLGDPHTAELTYPGYQRLNAVAGCQIGQPPSVIVDGEPRTNPYVQRTMTSQGRLGDIMRIVIAITVVGPAPLTGNPVVVNYTLDYDPSKDLQHMLARVADDHPDDCYLIDEDDVEKRPGWKFVPLYGGVGYLVNLRLAEVAGVYAEFVNIMQNAMKKAQTVCRRNAMRSHPALATQSAVMDDNGVAVVPVVGWAGDNSAMTRWIAIADKLSRGIPLPDAEDLERIELEGTYEADRDGAAEGDATPATAAAAASNLADERLRLIAQIDEGLDLLDPVQVAELGYRPETQTIDELRGVWTRLNALVDAGRR